MKKSERLTLRQEILNPDRAAEFRAALTAALDSAAVTEAQRDRLARLHRFFCLQEEAVFWRLLNQVEELERRLKSIT